jgi:signal transduction histidine kinase
VRLGKLPEIAADSLQMRQLFQNLISNALKFRLADTPPEISIDASVTDGVAAITVRDNGIGFDPQYSRRIFRIFERLHSRSEYPGTGIGLALCRKIAERHGGTITAESSPGAGATFTVTIPIDQRDEVIVAHSADENGEFVAREETYVTA